MERKRVSFKVAKAIKENGYPQDETEYKYTKEGNIFVPRNRGEDEKYSECDAPTYLDVWLWLWREKKLEIEVFNDGVGLTSQVRMQGRPQFFNKDPEESIIAAIEYLVDNDLIK